MNGDDVRPGEEPEEPAEAAEAETAASADEPFRDRFSAFVAVAIVLATLAAAVAGYLLALANRASDDAVVLAQRRAVEAADTLHQSELWAQAQYDTFVLGQEEAAAGTEAERRALFVGSARSEPFNLEADRWQKVSARSDDLAALVGKEFTGLQLTGPLGPDQDPAFPARFLSESKRQSELKQGLQDASNELGTRWNARSGTFTAILTMFAVALYLLGVSQTLRHRLRHWLSGMGAVFLIVGVAWMGVASLGRPTLAPDEAAVHFANGKVILDTAWDAYDHSLYVAAEAELRKAIRLRPTFARAFEALAGATYVASSPQTTGFPSITTPAALEESVHDEQRALDLGLENEAVLSSLGYDTFQLGLLAGRKDLLDRAVDLNQRAVALAPGEPVGHYNLAVSELAAGRTAEAEQTYRTAARLTNGDENVVAGALTDLELLRRHRPDLASQVDSMKELVVRLAFPGIPAAKASPSIDFAADPVFLSSSTVVVENMKPQGFDPNDEVVVEWYHDDPQHDGEFVVPEVSGPDFLTRSNDGTYFDTGTFLANTDPAQCVPAGSWRAEVYVGGHLAGSTPASTITPVGVGPSVLRDMNIAMCRPPDWLPDTVIGGVLEGFRSPDHSEGMFLLREDLSAKEATEAASQVTDSWLNAAVDFLSRDVHAFPAGLTPEKGTAGSYFMGLAGAQSKYFDYGGGRVLVGAGVNSGDQTVVVGLVFGPTREFVTGKGLAGVHIFDSMVQYQQ